MSRVSRRRLAWSGAVITLVLGLALTLTIGQEPVTFGWFAYQPLSEAPPPPAMALNAWGRAGVLLAVLGGLALIVLAMAALRSPRRGSRASGSRPGRR